MKTLETVAFIALEVGVAIYAPELLPATWSALAVSAATAAIEVGISLAANQLIGPSVPKGLGTSVANNQQRLFVSMDTTAPRKIVLGSTAGATDLRYQSYTGTNQRYYEQVIAVASHQVSAISEIWLDNEKAWTAVGGVQGRFAGFLTVDARTVGTSSNGIAIDSVWTSSCTLTGCAYIHLKFDLLGNGASGGTNNSPFASGVTSRVTIRTNGALVYDPRLDSTVSGGSGAQRAATQSTWAWDANASRNPALQLLFYLLGWKINGKLAVGMGMPPSRIDLVSFAVAANACDASITLNGGGTEPRYRADGVITEADDRQSVIESLCASMNAVLRDAGGKISLTVLTNDLATPVASFTEADILGEEQWDQTPDLSSTFNICRGRRVDPSDNALYQLVDVPEASLASNDGIDRIDTMDMPFVSSNGQAQRLLKQRLQRKQYQGKYTFTGNARWWQTSLGNVVQMSHAGLGWVNKLFRVAGQTIARDGTTKMTLIEENAAIYAWGNSESAAVTPGAPTIYDPLNSPLGVANAKLGTVESGATDGAIIGPGGNVTGSVDASGRATIDFASSHLNQNAQHLPYGDGTPVESLKPGEAGADVTATRAAVGDGNRVRFSRFEAGTKGWINRQNTTGGSPVMATGFNNGRAYIQVDGTFSGAGQKVSICTNFPVADYRIPVVPNERIYVGALPRIDTVPAGSTWSLTVAYLDSTGAAINGSTQVVGSGTGAFTPENFKEIFTNAHGAGYSAFVELTVTSGAAGACSFSLYNPMLCSAGASQTTRPAFNPGPFTEHGATLGGDLATNITNRTADFLLNGATYGLPLLTRLNFGRPTIDLSESIHSNVNAQHLPYGDGTPVESLKPAQAGADATTGKSLDILVNGATYGRTLLTRLNAGRPTIDFNEAIHANQGALSKKNSVDPSTTDVKMFGSIPPTVPGQQFTYTLTNNGVSTSGSITWPTITLYRADGTTVTVSSGSQSFSGLSATSNTYKVYPYVVDNGGTTGSVSFVTSGTNTPSGTPGIFFVGTGDAGAAANMYARGNIALGGFTIFVPSSGGGSGGGGGYACLHPDMVVGDVAAGALRDGDAVACPDGTDSIVWLGRRRWADWLKVFSGETEAACVTPEHRFYRANGEEVRARELRLGDLLRSAGDHVEVTGLIRCDEAADLVSIELPYPHLYYAGPLGLLCHNIKP